MTEQVLTNAAVIAILFACAGYLFKKWMDDLDRKITTLCQTNEKDHDDLWKRMNRHGHRIKGCPTDGYETAGVIVENVP